MGNCYNQGCPCVIWNKTYTGNCRYYSKEAVHCCPSFIGEPPTVPEGHEWIGEYRKPVNYEKYIDSYGQAKTNSIDGGQCMRAAYIIREKQPPEEKISEECSVCKYVLNKYEGYYCRRNPPERVSGCVTTLIAIEPEGWCGEFERRK